MSADDTRYILSSGSSPVITPGLSLGYHGYSASYKVALSTEAGHLWELSLPSDALTESDWHHITITWSAHTGLRLYRQGAVRAERLGTTRHGMIVFESNHRLRPVQSSPGGSDSLVIGKESAPGIADFTVELSDLQLWETVLPESRIEKLYKGTGEFWQSQLQPPQAAETLG